MSFESSEFGKYARVLLEDMAVEALLRIGRPLRTSELIAAMPDVEVNSSLLRGAMAGSSAVIPAERRWDLSTRHSAKGKTLDGMVDSILRTCGKPLPLQQIASEIGLLKSARAEQVAPTLRKFFRDRGRFVELTKDVFALEDWLLDTSADDEQAIIVENRLRDEEGFEELLQSDNIAPTASEEDQDGDWALRFLARAQRPVSHRVLEFFRWKKYGGDFDPADLLAALHEDERFVILGGGLVCTAEITTKLKHELGKLASAVEAAASSNSSLANLDELLSREVAPESRVTLRAEEVDDVVKYVASSQMPVSVLSLVQDIFELAPDDPAFVPTVHAAMHALDADGDFQKVGRDRYLLRQAIPPYLYQMPDALRPIQLDIRTMQDERIDLELDDEGLDGDLAEVIHSLEWEEAGEEGDAIRNQSFEAELTAIVCPVNVLHRRGSTLKLRYKDDRFFPPGANVVRLMFVDGESEFPVWVSRETGLIYDLGTFYESHRVGVGHVLRLKKTVRADRVEIEYKGEKHPLLTLDPSRLEHLEELTAKEDNQQTSLLDLLTNLLYDHPRGANFITLWHEVNVIRRTSKRLVASVLSSYHCFYPRRQGDQWFWRLDEDKIDQGFKRNKRKNVRK